MEDEIKMVNAMLKWGGGKRKLKKRIISRIPPHTTYIEPFLGGGAVAFAKTPAKRTILNDKDKELIQFYQAYRKPKVSVKKTDMTPSRKRFNGYKKRIPNPKHPQAVVNRYLYVNKHSYGGMMEHPSYVPIHDGCYKRSNKKTMGVRSITPEHKERLKHAKILSQDYKTVIKKYDGKNAFIYLDPPYPKVSKGVYSKGCTGDDITPQGIIKAVKSAKGKVMLSYPYTREIMDTIKKHGKGLHVEKVKTSYSIGSTSGRTDLGNKPKTELLIANYDMKAQVKSNAKKPKIKPKKAKTKARPKKRIKRATPGKRKQRASLKPKRRVNKRRRG